MSATGAAAPWRGGHKQNKFGERRIIFVFGGGFLALAALALLVAVLSKPAAPTSVCPKNKLCVSPRPGPPLPGSPRLVLSQLFTSSGLGYQFEYPAQLQAINVTPTDVTIAPPVSDPVLSIEIHGAPANQATPEQMLATSLSDLQGKIPDLQADSDPQFQVLAPALGGHGPGVGGFYQGNEQAPGGFVAPVDVGILAASDGQSTIAVSVICADRSKTDVLFKTVDELILETLRFRSDVPQ